MKKTKEQIEILSKVSEVLTSAFAFNDVIQIDAKAGCGKTTTIKMIVKEHPKKSFIYTAFNKKIVEDGIEVFGEENAKTFHALAYKYVNRVNLGQFYPNMIKDKLTYQDKQFIVNTIDKFCLSKYVYIEDFLIEKDIPKKYDKYIIKYLDKMANREIKHTFNYMLKELHHNLFSKETKIDIDMLFVDEAQDLTPVMLEIFELVQATVKVYLGDTIQDIYSFLDLISAFNSKYHTYTLSDSFRIPPKIAEKIDNFCKTNIDPTFKIVGHNTNTPTVNSILYITYTNAEIIEKIDEELIKGRTFSLTKPIEELFKTTLEVYDILFRKIPNKNPKYFGVVNSLAKGISLDKLSKDEEIDLDIRSSIKTLLLFEHKKRNVYDILNEAKRIKPNKNRLIATAHSIKGLETDVVNISNGLNRVVGNAMTSVATTEEEEEAITEICKLYYVACSRAKFTLSNAICLNIKRM